MANTHSYESSSQPAAPEYTRVTEANIAEIGQPIRLLNVGSPNRFVHPVPLKPFGVAIEAGRILIAVMGYVDEEQKQPFVTTVDAQSLSGIRATTVPRVGLVMAVRYLKQFKGLEDDERLVVPEGFYYGVHEGHMGDAEQGIGPENPGFYIAGEQFTPDGESQGIRNFPLTRLHGLMGDTTNPGFQAEHGLY